eukprot:g1545.t1
MGCCGSAVQTIYSVPEGVAGFFGSYELFVENNKAKPVVLGMLLLDGHKKPSIGSFHHAGAFDYQIKQEVVKGLTLEFWPCVQQGVVLSFRFFFACLLDV